ncbi:conserved hypothetical protein, secreted [Candidatus Magnetomorum sp. HK-1]|nr:conserved hypothetical protein, secreted [Candidatus Magnetomorum sp. HK-1]
MKILILSFLLVSVCLTLQAQENLTEAINIFTKSNQTAFYSGKDCVCKIRMIIKNKHGKIRERHFITLRKSEKKTHNQKFFMYFLRPTDVRSMSIMTWKNTETTDKRWLYLSALDTIKRIAPSRKRTSFVGSNFYYEDTTGRNINEDNHQLLKTTDEYYIFKNIPKAPSSVEFIYYIVWINRANYLPIKFIYYNKEKQKYRIIQALRLKNIQGYPTIIKQEALDLIRNEKTTIYVDKIKYNNNLDESMFTQTSLRHPPQKWISFDE